MSREAASAARTEARIKQLCCLGLGGEAIVPALLRELHRIIPSRGNIFLWSDELGRLSNAYGENPEFLELGPPYLGEFYNRREKEVCPGFTADMRSRRGVLSHDEFYTVDRRTLQRSDYYNLIMRPQGFRTVLHLNVRDGDRPGGVLQLERSRGEPDFTAVEKRRLARLEFFVAHALAPRATDADDTMVDSGESGLIIADREGRPLAYSPHARRLLYLAMHTQLRPGEDLAIPKSLPFAVGEICRRLTRTFSNEVPDAVPVARHQNVWGQFVFRAYWLKERDCDSDRIGITLTREEPLMLRLMQSLRDLPLSRRQAEIALLLASGLSHAKVAARLGISRNTVISHSRWIHTRLDVHDNAGLRDLLLRQKPTTDLH